MGGFNINKYRIPEPSEVDMIATKKIFEFFMSAYGSAREKVGRNRMPKITQSFELIPATTKREYAGDAERIVIEREMYLPEFIELDRLFWEGYSAISDPLKKGGTERRRQIFMLRYVHGITIQNVTERTYLSKTTVIDESKLGLIQFCKATEMLVMRNETEPLIKMD